jgi:hypothetical protein
MARAARRARVGILVECGREGLEVHFCRRICHFLREQHGARIAEEIVPMDNKRRLLEEGATAAGALLDGGCDRVVILWDEEPSWPERREPLCWHREREHLLASLRAQGLNPAVVHLVCIARAFESWLMFDGTLLSRFLSRPAHPIRVRPPANPHRLRNPKGVLMGIFRQHRQRYIDVAVARPLAATLDDLTRLRRCETFRRFAEKVMGAPL